MSSRGHCLCNAVQYEVRGPLRPVIYCHCEMCRRMSGHYVAATACARQDLQLHKAATLQWFQSSELARRGFCSACGSNLFWDPIDADYVAIMAGSLDTPTGLAGQEHIFVADKGDYYDILDALPQSAAWDFPGVTGAAD